MHTALGACLLYAPGVVCINMVLEHIYLTNFFKIINGPVNHKSRRKSLKRRSRTYAPCCVMTSSAMELQFGIFRTLLTTYTHTVNKTKQNLEDCTHNLCYMCTLVLLALLCSVAFCVCSTSCLTHSKCRWYVHLTNHGYLDHRQNLIPQFEPYASKKKINK